MSVRLMVAYYASAESSSYPLSKQFVGLGVVVFRKRPRDTQAIALLSPRLREKEGDRDPAVLASLALLDVVHTVYRSLAHASDSAQAVIIHSVV